MHLGQMLRLVVITSWVSVGRPAGMDGQADLQTRGVFDCAEITAGTTLEYRFTRLLACDSVAMCVYDNYCNP